MTEPSAQFAITLAQLNPTVGDVAGNAAKARAARARAQADGADLVVFPELFITGYPPEDLVLKPAFQSACRAAIEKLADRLTTEHDPQIGRVKDMGSAAVGVALVMAGLFWLFAIAERMGAV